MNYREDRFDLFGFESPFAQGEGVGSGSVFKAYAPSEYEVDLGSQFPFVPAREIERESETDPLKLKSMLGIPGRFDDAKRDPSIDKDGTRFEAFLNGSDRATFAQKWLAGCPALSAAAREPLGDLKSGDIAKAWFVIHDVGVNSSLGDNRFKAKDTKKVSVHGFVNRAGNYAATHDFAKRKSGTIYEFVSKRGQVIAGGKTINIETVPDIEVVGFKPGGTLPAPTNAASYASIGFRRNRPVRGKAAYYKWTKEAFDVIAELYILASARAGHLLTLTAHKEMDRNLGRSVIWRERSAAEMAKPATKYLKAARDRPSDYHGDPYAFDFQALYDVITRKLNALGGAQMPAGARYGIHPLRVRKANGEDIGNGDSQKHEFPHQSDPVVKRDTGLKKAGWWRTEKTGDDAKEYETDSEDFEPENFDDEAADPGHMFEDEFPSTSGENESFYLAGASAPQWTGEEENEDESLAWLDLEHAEEQHVQFEDEVERAVKPYGMPKALLGGKLWSSSDPKLGIKQAIFVSPAALNLGRAEILFYVHGLLGPCGGRPKGGMAAFISEAKFALGASVVASGRPMILIVPQFQDGGDASWSTHSLANPEGLNRYILRRLAEVGKMLDAAPPVVSDLIVAGHSKAYEVLYRIAQSHTSPAMAQGPLACLSGLWLLDASYGRLPQEAIAALLAIKPGLKVKVVYRAGSATDKFAGKQSDGRLTLIPVPAGAVSHCAIPVRCLPDLIANRAVGVSIAALPTREDHYAPDFASETEEDLFELEDEQGTSTDSSGEDADREDQEAVEFAEGEETFGEDYLLEEEEDAEDLRTDEWEDNEEPVAFSSDLAPEPYQIRGGLYTAQQKARAAKHPAGLLLTSSIVGPQESKLVNRGPSPILIGKELTRFEAGKLGVWIADYNAFTYDFEEVLRAMGRLRDLLSAGSPEAPGDMSAIQKQTFKPTDDSQASNAKKQAYTEWREAQKRYGGLVAEVPRTAREVGLARKDFWQAQGRLSRSIAAAKKLDKPAFEAIDFKLSDIVSVATSGSVAGGAVTGFALLADWLIEVRKKRAEYDKKLKEFAQTVKDTNAAVRDDLETFQNAGERYWVQVKLHREKVDERDKARAEARKRAALFAQSLAPASEKRKAVLAAIRMPAQIADAWRTLAIAGPRALKVLESLKARWSLLDAAIFHFKRSKPDPFGLEDITQIVLAARRAESWKGVLTKDDVEEWVAMNGLWDEAYAKFFV